MNEDATLLRRFVEDHAEEAFTELVQRHLGMVYGTALRRVGGDTHLAEDVTQKVFISLARKASSLSSHASVAGWLYVSAHHATAEVVRREQRRKQREASAHSMNLASTSDDRAVDPASLRPLLDDALFELKADDREAVVLRFFAQRSFAEIGAALRITEEAARKRVDRALEKLQVTLSRRGVTSTVTALGGALTATGMTSTPATLVNQVAAVALAQNVLLPAAALTATLTSSLLPAAAIAAVLTGLWTIVPQQRANAAMADAIARLEREHVATTGVQSEIDDLTRALALERTAPPSPARDELRATNIALTPDANARKVLLTPEGTLQWEGEWVNGDQFLARLVEYQSTEVRDSARLIVKAKGARAPQLQWVLDEVRKAGIKKVAIETDSLPAPASPAAWF